MTTLAQPSIATIFAIPPSTTLPLPPVSSCVNTTSVCLESPPTIMLGSNSTNITVYWYYPYLATSPTLLLSLFLTNGSSTVPALSDPCPASLRVPVFLPIENNERGLSEVDVAGNMDLQMWAKAVHAQTGVMNVTVFGGVGVADGSVCLGEASGGGVVMLDFTDVLRTRTVSTGRMTVTGTGVGTTTGVLGGGDNGSARLSPPPGSTTRSGDDAGGGGGNGLSGGAIAGIVVGGLVGATVSSMAILLLLYKRKTGKPVVVPPPLDSIEGGNGGGSDGGNGSGTNGFMVSTGSSPPPPYIATQEQETPASAFPVVAGPLVPPVIINKNKQMQEEPDVIVLNGGEGSSTVTITVHHPTLERNRSSSNVSIKGFGGGVDSGDKDKKAGWVDDANILGGMLASRTQDGEARVSVHRILTSHSSIGAALEAEEPTRLYTNSTTATKSIPARTATMNTFSSSATAGAVVLESVEDAEDVAGAFRGRLREGLGEDSEDSESFNSEDEDGVVVMRKRRRRRSAGSGNGDGGSGAGRSRGTSQRSSGGDGLSLYRLNLGGDV
ncbi:hypothetical protein HDU79_007305 [Rhizoclosmatium sp. JEL0117]|nr:hypothetical protein HDU79_007305 [Rhizoclosmatium sp. JEL0117]